jgi:hypothetical protein
LIGCESIIIIFPIFHPIRFSLYGGVPVQLNAYLVDTELDDSTPLQQPGYGAADSDSGISDTDQSPPRQEAEEDHHDDDRETSHVRGSFDDNFGLSGILTPPPEAEEDKPESGNVRSHMRMEDEEEMRGVEATVDLFSDEESVFFEDEAGMVFGPEIPPELVEAGIPEIEDHGAIQAIPMDHLHVGFFLLVGHFYMI